MSAMMALFYLRLRKVGTEFSHETAASDDEKLFKFEQVVHVHIGWHFKAGQGCHL